MSRMTDLSDLIERLLRTPDRNAMTQNTCQAQNSLLIDAASALSSHSLSLSEAREEIERLRAPREGAIGWNSDAEWEIEQRAFHAAGRDDVPKDVQELVAILWKQYCIAAEPLENSKAPLADATNDPADPGLSSLRKGAEELDAALLESTAMRHATGDHYSVEVFFTSLDSSERFRAHLAARCARIRSALVSGSREDGADA